MRALHRILSILACLLMLYLGATGTLMQLLDLKAILSHAPQDDATIQSINEGRYGNGDIAVLNVHDIDAKPLPTLLNYQQALATVLSAIHRDVPGVAPRFVELRTQNNQVIGQARFDTNTGFRATHDIRAWNTVTGASTQVSPQGYSPVPPVLRQNLKELHRFWSNRDVPGVWFELLSGIVMWVLIISGLWMYFKLLSARAKIGKGQPFWMGGGVWKSLHRIISVAASIFIIAIAFTGTWLGFESVWHTFVHQPDHDVSAPLNDDQVQAMAAATLVDFRRDEPSTPIKVLRVRVYSGMNQGVVITGGASTRQILYNTDTGKVASLTEKGYPVSGFPFGTQIHEDIKHFHSGDMFGIPTRLMNLLAGLALIYLSVSGIVMYYDLWKRRAKNGKSSPVWL